MEICTITKKDPNLKIYLDYLIYFSHISLIALKVPLAVS